MSTVIEAGGIVVRAKDSAARILVVRGRKNRRHWIFPKGHVEPKESRRTAARREVLEEAGVDAVPVAPAGLIEFVEDGRRIRVHYYLLRYVRTVDAGEGRQTRWCSASRARRLLTFPESRALLRKCVPLIRARLGLEAR